MSQPHVDPGPDGDASGAESAPRELPAVQPPSARFILQLFVIPALIVAVLIGVVALFGKLAEVRHDTSQYIEAIRSDNENVQFRAAYELANLIQNEQELARDPKLLGQLTDLLDRELAKKSGDPRVARFLAGALGVFQTLDGYSSSGREAHPLATLASALAPGRPIEVRVAAAESMARQAARLGGTLDDSACVEALAKAAEDPEPELRQRAVYALGFCAGAGALRVLSERVKHDDDRFVRFNAASALARRGDMDALDALREMLSATALAAALKSPHKAETNHQIESIQTEALKALSTSVREQRSLLAEQLRPQIAALGHSNLAAVRVEAGALLKILPVRR